MIFSSKLKLDIKRQNSLRSSKQIFTINRPLVFLPFLVEPKVLVVVSSKLECLFTKFIGIYQNQWDAIESAWFWAGGPIFFIVHKTGIMTIIFIYTGLDSHQKNKAKTNMTR